MTSTIQLSQKVKETLTTYKVSPNESYEDVIINLISEVENKKQKDEELLKESCIELTKESLKITKEWEHLDNEVNTVWEKK